MNNKKTKGWLIFLFVAFAVTSFIGTSTGFILLPIAVWVIFAITIIKIGIKNVKNGKGNSVFKELTDEIEKNKNTTIHENEKVDIFKEAVEKNSYDECDNEKCDSHTSIKDIKKCPLCATMNDENAKYCKICGEELDKEIF